MRTGPVPSAGSIEATGLDEVVARAACLYAERPALWVAGRAWNYAELRSTARRLAAGLAGTAGAQCGILAARSLTAFAGVLGALSAGLAYVPLNPRHPPERLLAALLASDCAAVVVDDSGMSAAAAVLPACPRPLCVLFPESDRSPDWIEKTPHEALCRSAIAALPEPGPRRTSPEEPAYLSFTSGSTGAPKGVLVTHGNVLAYLRSALERWTPSPSDRFTQLFDLSFDLSVHDMFVCWSAGACLYCPPAAALLGPAKFVRCHRLTVWFSTPSTAAMMDRLRMLEPDAFPSLRLSLFCGEALPTGLARKWRRAAPRSVVENVYGPTEATIAITAHRLEGDPDERWPVVPIGRPFSGQEAVVVDPEGRPLPDGEPGELCLGGDQVTHGYWRCPEATAARFRPPEGRSVPARWYRTGDLVVNDSSVGLVFLGRLDRQVKIRGHRVELQEVEAVLRAALGAESVAALAWPPDPTAPARAIIAFAAGEPRPVEAALAACRARLPAAVAPRELRFVRDWPLNANGKTDHAALAGLMGNGGENGRGERGERC